jgi:hypothetical protein
MSCGSPTTQIGAQTIKCYKIKPPEKYFIPHTVKFFRPVGTALLAWFAHLAFVPCTTCPAPKGQEKLPVRSIIGAINLALEDVNAV